MLLIDEFTMKVSKDAYGGSAELVDDAILCYVNELRSGKFASAEDVFKNIEHNVDATLEVCSPILPLINLLNICMSFVEENENIGLSVEETVDKACEMLEKRRKEQASCLDRIGDVGEKMVPDGAKFSTFSTSGSVMSILQKVKDAGKHISVTCHEARPHNEGYRTFKEVAELGFPVTLGTDAAITDLLPKSDIFIIGADAITSIGQVYAKMGSYLAALACQEFSVPFYVAADTSKFDLLSMLGFPLKDSSRPSDEVSDMAVPEGCRIANVSFELIPPKLISGIITENGVISTGSVAGMMDPDHMSRRMVQKLINWNTK